MCVLVVACARVCMARMHKHIALTHARHALAPSCHVCARPARCSWLRRAPPSWQSAVNHDLRSLIRPISIVINSPLCALPSHTPGGAAARTCNMQCHCCDDVRCTFTIRPLPPVRRASGLAPLNVAEGESVGPVFTYSDQSAVLLLPSKPSARSVTGWAALKSHAPVRSSARSGPQRPGPAATILGRFLRVPPERLARQLRAKRQGAEGEARLQGAGAATGCRRPEGAD